MDNRQNNGSDNYHRSSGLEVRVRYTGNTKEERDRDLEKALALFKKLVSKEGLLQELRDRESFRSNTEKRRIKQKEALQRIRLADKKRKAREARESKNGNKRDWHR